MRNYQLLLVSLFCFWITYLIMSGEYSRYFAGELNELGCAVISLSMGTLTLLGLNWKKLGQWFLSY